MKARKYRFESEAIASPLISALNEADLCVIINNNEDFAMVPAKNPNFNPELPVNLDTNYPLMQVAINETQYCVDVLWANEPQQDWAQYEIKIVPSPLMIHKFDKFGLTQAELLPIMNEYLNSYRISKFNTTQAMGFMHKNDPAWEQGVVDNISSIHNNSLAIEGSNPYGISIAVFDGLSKTVNFTAKLISSNAADRFYLYKYAEHTAYTKKENGVQVFALEPGQEIASNVTVENLNILEFRYVKAEGGEATDRAHITNVTFA
jgi:hypothetical protein